MRVNHRMVIKIQSERKPKSLIRIQGDHRMVIRISMPDHGLQTTLLGVAACSRV